MIEWRYIEDLLQQRILSTKQLFIFNGNDVGWILLLNYLVIIFPLIVFVVTIGTLLDTVVIIQVMRVLMVFWKIVFRRFLWDNYICKVT